MGKGEDMKKERIFVSPAFDNSNLFEDYLKLLKQHKFVHAKYEYEISSDCIGWEKWMEELDEYYPRFYREYSFNTERHLFINEQSFLQEACHLREANIKLKELYPNLEIIRDKTIIPNPTATRISLV